VAVTTTTAAGAVEGRVRRMLRTLQVLRVGRSTNAGSWSRRSEDTLDRILMRAKVCALEAGRQRPTGHGRHSVGAESLALLLDEEFRSSCGARVVECRVEALPLGGQTSSKPHGAVEHMGYGSVRAHG
jgi:hypothetical protein